MVDSKCRVPHSHLPLIPTQFTKLNDDYPDFELYKVHSLDISPWCVLLNLRSSILS